ncbi:MAG: glycosyltransferase [Eubacteriales bacterium]|nr:glycosyltransferase [Eubacteriales bacterium]
MYKVLFVISQLHKAGAESSLVNLLHKMDKKKYDIDFLVMNQVPVEGATSLIGDVPPEVHLCNVYEEDRRGANFLRRACLGQIQGDRYFESAIKFVHGKEYDLAVHVGEWWTPEFVALCVRAKHKTAWFHADIDKQASFSAQYFFAFDPAFDSYLFVSQHSMDSACKAFPFIRERSYILHNCIDREQILRLSEETPPAVHKGDKPLVITVANLRTEKNHLRALEAMRILHEKGYDFTWWNVGHRSVPQIAAQLEENARRYGVAEDFLLLGAHKNPYPLLRQADALACLSDHESWSLVITEARCLGVPLIATKTSGAQEQVIDGKNGVLTDFTAESIAEGIERALLDRKFNAACKQYLKTVDAIPDPIAELEQIMRLPARPEPARSVLYVIDDVNYQGGAHHAVFQHIRVLQKNGVDVAIYSAVMPEARVRTLLPGVRFYGFGITRENMLFDRRLLGCLLAKDVSPQEKKMRVDSFMAFRKNKNFDYVSKRMEEHLLELASGFEVVCLLSEGSRFKKIVAESRAKRKIQWIHTDYCTWSGLTDYAKELTKDDGETWKKMDDIVVLADTFVQPLAERYPHLKEKIRAIGNCQPVEQILEKARRQVKQHLNVVCVLDKSDAQARAQELLEDLMRLKKERYSFYWIIVGLPFETLREYPELNDSVTCMPDAASLDARHLLANKDLLIAPEGEKAILAAADRLCVPAAVRCTGGEAEQTPAGWKIPLGRAPVGFVLENMLSVDRKKKVLAARDRDEAGNPTGEAKAPLHFVSCFRFEPVKNVGGMIRALGRLHISGVRFHWTFIGDGEEMPLARQLVADYGMQEKITFTGSLENPYPLMRRADVFVQFSRYEGLPNTIYEALILGVPVLSTNVGAIPDQIEQGKTGWLIEPKEAALSEAVLHLVQHPEELRAVRENLKQYRYDNEAVERDLVDIFTNGQMAKPRAKQTAKSKARRTAGA